MFFGEFEYRIDDKGRVPIPPKFRAELKEGGLVLAPGVEKCITVYTMTEWDKFAASLTSGPTSPSKLRKLYRAIFATAFSTELDGQGRVIVPATLRQYAGLEEEVVIAGANNYLELWSKGRWEEEKNDSQEEAWHIIESMEKR